MPYITEETRRAIDPYIAPLCEQLHSTGDVNYAITRILCRLYVPSLWTYADINNAIGVLECVKQEFYRRVAVPYEDKKKEQNGDVYL